MSKLPVRRPLRHLLQMALLVGASSIPLLGLAAASPAGAAAAPAHGAAAAPAAMPHSYPSVWASINALRGYQTETDFNLLLAGAMPISPADECKLGNMGAKDCTGTICRSGGKEYAEASTGNLCMWVNKQVVALAENLGNLGLTWQEATPIALSMACDQSEFVASGYSHPAYSGPNSEENCLENIAGPVYYDDGVFVGSEFSNTLNWWFYQYDQQYLSGFYTCFVDEFGASALDPFTFYDAGGDTIQELWNVTKQAAGDANSCAD